MKAKKFGRYIVSDPLICHGHLTYRGTRVMVGPVLELLEAGRDWDNIIKQFNGSITRAAIAETIRLANRALSKQAEAYRKTVQKLAKSA
jgi:uncharacterized protein (DUF433 family)